MENGNSLPFTTVKRMFVGCAPGEEAAGSEGAPEVAGGGVGGKHGKPGAKNSDDTRQPG